MINGKTVTAIIPARAGSKRLKNKNIYPVYGYPMLSWAINACRRSKYIDYVFVSSDSDKILRIAENFGASVIERPADLADDKTCKQDVIVDAIQHIGNKPDIVISLQPNSPEVLYIHLDRAIEKLLEFDRNEIFSVGTNLIQNAAFRVMKYDYAFQKTISTKCGVFITDYVDIHTKEDVELAECFQEPAAL